MSFFNSLSIVRFFYLLIFTACAFGCNVTRHLPEEGLLVKKNKLQLETEEKKLRNRSELSYKLYSYIQQEPNEQLFGFLGYTKLWAYYQTDEPSDSSTLKKWMRKALAEPPVLYNPEATKTSAQSMINYLQTLGYWDAQVKTDSTVKDQKVTVSYQVSPGQRYYADSVYFISRDSSIEQILQRTRKLSHLQKGVPIEISTYNAEVGRVMRMLRDSGYFFFNSSYIDQLEVIRDTLGRNQVDVRFIVLPREDGSFHQRYRIGDIRVFPSFENTSRQQALYRSTVDSIEFVRSTKELSIRPEVILEQVYLSEKAPTSLSLQEKTRQQLSQLDLYRYISLRTREDSLRPQHINYDIQLIPKKKWSIGYDAELNTSSSPISNALIGGALNFNLTNRNLFRGGEALNTNASLSIELPRQFDNFNRIINSLEVNLETGIRFPTFIDPFGLYNKIGGVRLFGTPVRNILQENTQSELRLGYSYVWLQDFFQYNQFQAAFSYNARPSPNTSIAYTPIGADYLTVNTFNQFANLQNDNPFLERSFTEQQLFTGFVLKEIDYIWRTPISEFGESWRLSWRLETSGLEALLVNGLVNSFSSGPPDTLRIAGVPFAHYTLGEVDGRYFHQLNPKQTLALRGIVGAAVPLATTAEIPYVRQFFVGGPTSIRAFQIRELGPGGYYDFAAVDSSTQFYQTGDFKLEFSFEYRFDLFWYFEGAFFVDIGNVWTLQEDPARPGSQLLWRWQPEKDDSGRIIADNFLNQMAVGAGFGLRIDLDYFIIRLDMGYPVRNNFPKPDPPNLNSYWNVRGLNDLQFENVNFNLAIGYPF